MSHAKVNKDIVIGITIDIIKYTKNYEILQREKYIRKLMITRTWFGLCNPPNRTNAEEIADRDGDGFYSTKSWYKYWSDQSMAEELLILANRSCESTIYLDKKEATWLAEWVEILK
jgi:hypothetical protein